MKIKRVGWALKSYCTRKGKPLNLPRVYFHDSLASARKEKAYHLKEWGLTFRVIPIYAKARDLKPAPSKEE